MKVPIALAESATPGTHAQAGRSGSPPALRRWIAVPVVPFASVGATTAFGFVLSDLVAIQNISMLYLAAVVVSAVSGGGLSAVLAAALSFLAYNYFFIEPRLTFTVARPDELLALVMFLAVALVTGSLAAQLRRQAAAAREQERATRELYDFARALSGALSLEAVGETIVTTLSRISPSGVMLLLPDAQGRLEVLSASGEVVRPDAEGLAGLQRYFEAHGPGPSGPLRGPGTPYVLTSGLRRLGVVCAAPADRETSGQRPTHFDAMLEQAAVAIDRALWAKESAAAALAHEAHRLHAALLSSLSHDLRTPLASITGAATSLQQLGDRMDEATRNDLLQSIAEDAGRLNRFVGNLFDMTRIESGGLKVRLEATDLAEVTHRALRRAQNLYPELRVDLRIEADLPAVTGDPILVEQALFNILDNARKYAGTDRPVSVRVATSEGRVHIAILDQGPGISAEDLERIFDKFYRRAKGDGRPAGTGLGLSIARGFIGAMGGSVRAESPVHGRRGARFVISLPVAQAPRP